MRNVNAWAITPRLHGSRPIICRLCRLNHNRSATTGQTVNHGIEPAVQPTEVREDGRRTYRTREQGNKSLPLPAIMDPILIAAKEKYAKPKLPDGAEEMTEFQRELLVNPYAQALAGKVRQCSLTHARVPAHFLLPFVSEVDQADAAEPPTKRRARLVPKLGYQPDKKVVCASYMLWSQAALRGLRKKSKWTRLVSRIIKENYAPTTNADVRVKSIWQWNEDVHDEVLRALRDDAVRNLKAVVRQTDPALNLPLNADAPLLNPDRNAACLMSLSGSLGVKVNSTPGLPCFDLFNLLSPDQIQESLDQLDLGEATLLSLGKTPSTTAAVLSLLKLQAYMRS